jgi:hypothetical protein
VPCICEAFKLLCVAGRTLMIMSSLLLRVPTLLRVWMLRGVLSMWRGVVGGMYGREDVKAKVTRWQGDNVTSQAETGWLCLLMSDSDLACSLAPMFDDPFSHHIHLFLPLRSSAQPLMLVGVATLMAYSFLQGDARSRDRVDIACAHADLEAGDTGGSYREAELPMSGKAFSVCSVVYFHSLALLEGEGRWCCNIEMLLLQYYLGEVDGEERLESSKSPEG